MAERCAERSYEARRTLQGCGQRESRVTDSLVPLGALK
jgi:hypothetical protein